MGRLDNELSDWRGCAEPCRCEAAVPSAVDLGQGEGADPLEEEAADRQGDEEDPQEAHRTAIKPVNKQTIANTGLTSNLLLHFLRAHPKCNRKPAILHHMEWPCRTNYLQGQDRRRAS
eukprot:GHVT01018384.1.p1 GENE.GHVT01018384.1~~GHVT01018384.1.p1  ORF type:complete len:118 (+),score=10.56 GHVT01018384.1:683-1036(+)